MAATPKSLTLSEMRQRALGSKPAATAPVARTWIWDLQPFRAHSCCNRTHEGVFQPGQILTLLSGWGSGGSVEKFYVPSQVELDTLRRRFPTANPKDPDWNAVQGILLAEGHRLADLREASARELVAMLVVENAAPADEPGPVADPSPAPAPHVAQSKAVTLYDRATGPRVNMKTKAVLTGPQYDVILSLIQAGSSGLTKDALDRQSKHGDARKIMGRLAESDPDWKAVLLLAGKPSGHYRIR